MSFTLTKFTPAEVAEVSGLSTMMQRDWRRRGYLPTTEGHARFDAFGLAELFVMKELADLGAGPVKSGEVAQLAAITIVWRALQLVDAYEGDHLRTFEWEPEGRGAKRAPDPEIVRAAEDSGVDLPPGFDEPKIPWAAQAAWITRRIMSRRRVRAIPARFLILWADDSHAFERSLDEAFSDVSTSAKYARPVIVLDLEAAASTLIERVGGAFVHVEYDRDRAGNVLSPDPEIEYGEPIPLR